MRRILFLIAALLAHPAFAGDDEPYEVVIQSFLSRPDLAVIGADGVAVGMLAPAIRRIAADGGRCELLGYAEETGRTSLLCLYGEVPSDPRSFDYDFDHVHDRLIVKAAHVGGRARRGEPLENAEELSGAALIAHTRAHFGAR